MSSKLLIIPGNGAIRQNKEKPGSWINVKNQELLPGVRETLQYYKANGYRIIAAQNEAGVAAKKKNLPDTIAEFMKLMVKLAPEIDETYICTDFAGKYCYRLVREDGEPVPSVQRYRALSSEGKRGEPAEIVGYAPQDEGVVFTQVAGVLPFRKSDPGMLQLAYEFAKKEAAIEDCVLVYERAEDYYAAEKFGKSLSKVRGRAVPWRLQSAVNWRQKNDFNFAEDPNTPPPAPEAPPAPPAAPATPPAQPQVRRWNSYEFRNGTSDKFWRICRDGVTNLLWFGRNGQAGTRQTKVHHSHSDAQSYFDRRIREQLRQGYYQLSDHVESIR